MNIELVLYYVLAIPIIFLILGILDRNTYGYWRAKDMFFLTERNSILEWAIISIVWPIIIMALVMFFYKYYINKKHIKGEN